MILIFPIRRLHLELFFFLMGLHSFLHFLPVSVINTISSVYLVLLRFSIMNPDRNFRSVRIASLYRSNKTEKKTKAYLISFVLCTSSAYFFYLYAGSLRPVNVWQYSKRNQVFFQTIQTDIWVIPYRIVYETLEIFEIESIDTYIFTNVISL